MSDATRSRARRALLVLAAVCAALVARTLHSPMARVGPFRTPSAYPLAAIASLALAGWGALGGGRRRGPLIAGCLGLALFVANDRRLPSGDTHPAALVPYALLRHGTLSLDAVAPRPPPPWIAVRGGRLWSHFPVTAGIVALPVYVPAALGPGPLDLPQAEKLAAALMSALSVGLVLATLARLRAPAWLAVAATLLYAAGSPVLTTTSQALWQHAPSVLFLSALLWAAVRARAAPRFAWAAGAFAGVAVAARPSDAIVAAAVLAWIAARSWRAAVAFAVAALPPLALVALYNAHVFGAPWASGYGAETREFTAPLGAGLAGVLASPTRGLFTFVPWSVLALCGLAVGARRDGLFRALLAACAVTIAIYARWHTWWGGWCYGPRLLSDLTPLLALGLAPLAALPRRWVAGALAVTGAAAVALSAFGAFAARTEAGRRAYEVETAAEASDWTRYPPAAVLRRR